MKNFKRNNRSGGRKDSRRQEMHKAVCSECGKECEVPFKPTGDKPVFCSDCFRDKRGGESKRFSQRDSGDKRMYKAICDECGKECEVPFRPTSDKPIYCSQCFSNRGGGKDKSSDQTSKQFEIINDKLDKILKELSSHISQTKISKSKIVS